MSGIDHLLDTNVVIGLLKGSEPALALAQQSGLVMQRAAVSQITRMELLGFPALQEQEERVTLAFLSRSSVCQIFKSLITQQIQKHLRIVMKSIRHWCKNFALSTSSYLQLLARMRSVLAYCFLQSRYGSNEASV